MIFHFKNKILGYPNANFIFVFIPKTASSSIYKVLKGKIRFLYHDLRSSDYISLSNYLTSPGRGQRPLFSFAIVRNPWDRVVSSFFYLSQGGLNNSKQDEQDIEKFVSRYQGNFTDFVKNEFQNRQLFAQIHFRPQYEWITDENGKLCVSFIGRFENLQHDFDFACDSMNIERQMLAIHNKSKHKLYKEYYNEETKQIVANAYKEDIELFNYSF